MNQVQYRQRRSFRQASSRLSPVFIGVVAALTCETLFGLSYLFTKAATSAHATEFQLMSWRFVIAVLFMGLLWGLRIVKINLRGKNLRPMLLVAFYSPVLYFSGETFGISHTTASETGIILAACPVATLVASSIILRKKPFALQVTGILVTVGGVVIATVAKGVSASLSPFGYAMLALATVSYALYVVYVVRAAEFNASEMTFLMVAVGAVVFAVCAVIETATGGLLGSGTLNTNLTHWLTLPFRDSGFLTAALYQGIGCSVAAYFCSVVAIAKLGANRTASFVGFSTVVSIIAAVIFLDETFTPLQALGTLVIMGGVYMANMSRRDLPAETQKRNARPSNVTQ